MTGRRGRVFVISSPSGGGKTTIAQKVIRRVRRLVRSVSCTTRRPRSGERHGRDYFFMVRAEFDRIRRNGGFLEEARVFGQHYGTPRAFVERNLARGRDVLLVIDVQGAMKVRKRVHDAVLIFVMPPSMQELRRRLVGRKLDTSRTIERRLKVSRREIAKRSSYDYVIVNRDIRQAARELAGIIRAERSGRP